MKSSVLEDKVRERKLLDNFFDEDMMNWSKGALQKYNKKSDDGEGRKIAPTESRRLVRAGGKGFQLLWLPS